MKLTSRDMGAYTLVLATSRFSFITFQFETTISGRVQRWVSGFVCFIFASLCGAIVMAHLLKKQPFEIGEYFILIGCIVCFCRHFPEKMLYQNQVD